MGKQFQGSMIIFIMNDCNRREVELGRDSSQSMFLLKKSSCQSTIALQADFSPLTPTQQPSGSSCTLPMFNQDGLHFTPSFILSVDQERYVQNRELYDKLHQHKVAEISVQKPDLWVPRPSKNNSFCCVCRTPFQDYLQHTATPKHKILILKSEYNLKIHQLCQLFKQPPISQPAKKRRGRPAKTKLIRKESLASTARSSSSIQEKTPLVSQFSINP